MTTLKDQIKLIERLDQLIRLKATGTPKDLAKKLNLSRRQVYRIVEEMKNMGFPIAYSRSRKTFYYEMKVRFTFEVCAMEEKEIKTTAGGKKITDFLKIFLSVPDFGTERGFLCGS